MAKFWSQFQNVFWFWVHFHCYNWPSEDLDILETHEANNQELVWIGYNIDCVSSIFCYPPMKHQIDYSKGCGGGGGQVVIVLTIYSDNPSSNPTEVYSFFVKFLFKKNKNKKK